MHHRGPTDWTPEHGELNRLWLEHDHGKHKECDIIVFEASTVGTIDFGAPIWCIRVAHRCGLPVEAWKVRVDW